MNKQWIIGVSIVLSAPAVSQAPGRELTPDQKGYIAYDQCLMHAAMKVSYTSAKSREVYEIAKRDCAPIRASVVKGLETNAGYLKALNGIDAEKAANFPAWVEGVRKRRAARDAEFARPSNAPN